MNTHVLGLMVILAYALGLIMLKNERLCFFRKQKCIIRAVFMFSIIVQDSINLLCFRLWRSQWHSGKLCRDLIFDPSLRTAISSSISGLKACSIEWFNHSPLHKICFHYWWALFSLLSNVHLFLIPEEIYIALQMHRINFLRHHYIYVHLKYYINVTRVSRPKFCFIFPDSYPNWWRNGIF